MVTKVEIGLYDSHTSKLKTQSVSRQQVSRSCTLVQASYKEGLKTKKKLFALRTRVSLPILSAHQQYQESQK